MKAWEDVRDLIRKIDKNPERARSLLKFAGVRLNSICKLDNEKETPLIVEGYYEAMKELITGLMAVEGFKTTSHEALVVFLKKNCKDFDDYEINLIDELRKLRNKICYEGYLVEEHYLKRNRLEIRNIIKKLKSSVIKKLK